MDYDVEALDVDLFSLVNYLLTRTRGLFKYLAGRSVVEEMEPSLFASCDYAWCRCHFECTFYTK